jgi:hypothetical protein
MTHPSRARALFALVLALAFGAISPAGATTTRTETVPYEWAATNHRVVIDLPSLIFCYSPSYGGNCFELEDGETTVDVSVDDDEAASVLVRYSFRLPDFDSVTGDFCDSATLTIPDDAIDLFIIPMNELTPDALSVCPNAELPTTGWTTAEFS